MLALTGHRRPAMLASLVLIVGLLAMAAGSANADEPAVPTSTFVGTITDEAGRPMEGVQVVTATFDDAAPPDTTYDLGQPVSTDAAGRYTAIVPVGYTVLTFSIAHHLTQLSDPLSTYAPRAKRIKTVAGQTVTVNATMRRVTPTSSTWDIQGPRRRLDLGARLAVPPLNWQMGDTDVPASALTLTYQWNRLTHVGKKRTDTPIPGETSTTYVTREADLGKQVSVTVKATHPLLKTAVVRPETANPIMRYSRLNTYARRGLKGMRVQIKARVTVDGLRYASGKVRATCQFDDGRQLLSKKVALKKGRATLRFTAKGAKKRDSSVRCYTEYLGRWDTWSTVDPPFDRRAPRIKLKR